MGHNIINAGVMSRVCGERVLKKDFKLEEDISTDLGKGVTWRRRRFHFLVDDKDQKDPRPEALCINEVTLDSHSSASICPAIAADYPHLVDMKEIENAYWATTFASGALRSDKGVKETRLFCNLQNLFYTNSETNPKEMLALLKEVDPANKEAALNLKEYFDCSLIEQEGDGFGVSRYLPAFPVSRLVQSSENILAATNAGYFLNFPEEYDDGVSCLHQPVGGHLVDGRLVVPCWITRPGIVGFRSGNPSSALFGPENMEVHLDGFDPIPLQTLKPDHQESLHGCVWRSHEEKPEFKSETTAALSWSGNVLVSIDTASNVKKPLLGGAVVFLEGEAAEAVLKEKNSSLVSLKLKDIDGREPEWLVSAGPFLVRDSQVLNREEILSSKYAGEFASDGPPPTRFPFDTDKTQAPRTAFGVLPSGGLKIVVVDGRKPGEHSCGLALSGLAELLQHVGCETAINLDGGGSSVLAVEGASHDQMLLENCPHGVVNIPSDAGGNERIVPVMMIVRDET